MLFKRKEKDDDPLTMEPVQNSGEIGADDFSDITDNDQPDYLYVRERAGVDRRGKKDKRIPGPCCFAFILFAVLTSAFAIDYSHYRNAEKEFMARGTFMASVLADRAADPDLNMQGDLPVSAGITASLLKGINAEYIYIFSPDGKTTFTKPASTVAGITVKVIRQLKKARMAVTASLDIDSRNHVFDFYHPIVSKHKITGYLHLGLLYPRYYYFVMLDYRIWCVVLLVSMLVSYLLKQRLTLLVKGVAARLGSDDSNDDIAEADMPEFLRPLLMTTPVAIGAGQDEELEKQVWNMKVSNRLLLYEVRNIEAVLDLVHDGVMVTDNSGMVRFANKPIESMINRSRDELAGRELSSVLDNLDDPELTKFIMANFRNMTTSRQKELKLNGRVMMVSTAGINIDKKGVQGAVIKMQDITAGRYQKQLQYEFITHTAHEVKLPLQTIGRYCKSSYDNSLSEEARSRYINNITLEADRLCRLVDNLLNIAKFEMGNLHLRFGTIKTGPFIEEIYKINATEREDKKSFKLVLPDKLSNIRGDKDILTVAVCNLISNAFKYTSEGDNIILRAEESNKKIMIHVIDNGAGISNDDMPHIFEKFYRSGSDSVQGKGGHGLGLSLVEEIVNLHSGEIKVKSSEGDGSQFTVVLNVDYETVL